jgi:hypothetical protein
MTLLVILLEMRMTICDFNSPGVERMVWGGVFFDEATL